MSLTIALAQSNSIVGYTEANVARLSALYEIAVSAKADLVVFPEMALTGYPIEDLARSKHFQAISMDAAEKLASLTTKGTAILIGGLWRDGDAVYNAAFLMDKGKIIYRQHKHHLPDYGIFDETRVFTKGQMPEPFEWRGIKLGLLICEDMWLPDVSAHLKSRGAGLLIVINASPYEMDKADAREQVARQRVEETALPLVYVNHVGGQDELVFDGRSFVLSAQGKICIQLKAFQEDMGILRWTKHNNNWIPESGTIQPRQSREEAIYHAMMLGLADFVQKNGFAGVVLGMSGGIDSALSAAVAKDALGNEWVRCVMMPSPFTSRESIEDASECANRLGIRLDTISIEPGMQGFDAMIAPLLGAMSTELITGTNQPRLRASILTAISNKERLLLLNTGNKSEMAVGYTTIYGDMCGHYSVLKDIYKTTVYQVAKWRNTQGDVIPERIITKAPSAELKHNQKDQDTLPPYELLDEILLRLVEQNLSVDEIVASGFDRITVEQVSHMLFAAEYKRRQSCPGVKISGMSFYRDRRYPLTSGWRGMKLSL